MNARYEPDPRLTPAGLVVMHEAETYPVEPAPATRDREAVTFPVFGDSLGDAVVISVEPKGLTVGFGDRTPEEHNALQAEVAQINQRLGFYRVRQPEPVRQP